MLRQINPSAEVVERWRRSGTQDVALLDPNMTLQVYSLLETMLKNKYECAPQSLNVPATVAAAVLLLREGVKSYRLQPPEPGANAPRKGIPADRPSPDELGWASPCLLWCDYSPIGEARSGRLLIRYLCAAGFPVGLLCTH